MAKRSQSGPMAADPWRNWHRLFGVLLKDQLTGSPFIVELEKDLSERQQLVDVVVVRRGRGELLHPLPDGLNDLVDHNLISFKSYREALDDWTLKELTGHYVNYRKQVSPRDNLLPESQFRMYAVCARHPRDLFARVSADPVQPGVYTCLRGSDAIRIIVAVDLPLTEQNAFLHLFSAATDRVEYGTLHHRIQTSDTTTIVRKLVNAYRLEGLNMPYTMEDFRMEVLEEYFEEATPEERQAFLERLTLEQRLAGLSVSQIEAFLKRSRKRSSASNKRKPKSKD